MTPVIKIVFTGGPSGGKTSLIEILRDDFGDRVAVAPEAATLLYRGGWPRRSAPAARRRVQRAIYYLQKELEGLVEETSRAPVMLCDRGSLDGGAYWPGDARGFLASVGTTAAEEARRYDMVFHLRTPHKSAYRHTTVRTETPREALWVDARVEAAWRAHPKRFVIDGEKDFVGKIRKVREILAREVPRVFGKKK